MTIKRRLRILRVVTTSECIPWHLSNTLKRINKDFDVCITGNAVSQYQATYPDIQFIDIHLARKVNIVSDLIALFSLCKLINKYKPDVVHSIMPKAGLLGAIASFICCVPIRIHTFTGQVWATKKGLVRLILKTLDRFVVLLNTTCLTDSPSQSLFLYEQHISLHGRPLPVLSKGSLSGVDVYKFNKARVKVRIIPMKKELGITDKDFVFAFIARKSIDKGAIDVLMAFLKVVQKHPNAKLLFIGPDESGGQVDKVLNADSTLRSHVLNIGTVKNHEDYLAITNVLCLPSYREGFGSIVIDAAAMSVPTIGTNIPGLVDAIDDGETGVLVPPGNIDRLASVMNSFVETTELAIQMGKQARARVEMYFSADILYQELKKIYVLS